MSSLDEYINKSNKIDKEKDRELIKKLKKILNVTKNLLKIEEE